MSGPPTQNGAPPGFTPEGQPYTVSPPSYYEATGPNFTELFTVSHTRASDVSNSYFLMNCSYYIQGSYGAGKAGKSLEIQ